MNSDARSFEDDLSSLKADVAVIRSNYVTKADLQEVRIELKGEIGELRVEVRTEIAALRTELHQAMSALTWRLLGCVSALVVVSHLAAKAGY
jgi:hypothetical protein